MHSLGLVHSWQCMTLLETRAYLQMTALSLPCYLKSHTFHLGKEWVSATSLLWWCGPESHSSQYQGRGSSPDWMPPNRSLQMTTTNKEHWGDRKKTMVVKSVFKTVHIQLSYKWNTHAQFAVSQFQSPNCWYSWSYNSHIWPSPKLTR